MAKTDAKGRPLVNTPHEALAHLEAKYDAHRLIATLTFKAGTKVSLTSEYEHMMREAERAIAGLREARRGDLASEWRRVEMFVHALRDEMRMWLFLEERNAHAAWESLVRAQANAYWAAVSLTDFEPARQLDAHLESVERVVFPEQHFFSPGMIVHEGEVECSICHARGGGCEHIVGEIYDGEMAARFIHGVDLREVSLVTNPANKNARARSYSGIDLLTGESVKTVVRRQKRSLTRRQRRERSPKA